MTVLATNDLRLDDHSVPRNIERYAGSYSVARAARLLKFSLRHVRSYARLRDKDGKPWSKEPSRREHFLAFRDLMELRVARDLHGAGMPWRDICQFVREEVEEFGGRGHFISHRYFLTANPYALGPNHSTLEKLTAPVEYDDWGSPLRWNISREWDIATREAIVVLDPRLSFGSPVIWGCYVPTYILQQALLAEEGDHEAVARDYEVSVAQVKLAQLFETMLLWDDAVLA